MNPVPADSKNNAPQSRPQIRESCWSTHSFTLLHRRCQKSKTDQKPYSSQRWLHRRPLLGTVKKQLQCLCCIPKHQTQTCFPLNKDLLAGTFVEAALGFVSQPQLTSTCFESPWKSRSGFNNKSSKFFEFSCTERETGNWKLFCKSCQCNQLSRFEITGPSQACVPCNLFPDCINQGEHIRSGCLA